MWGTGQAMASAGGIKYRDVVIASGIGFGVGWLVHQLYTSNASKQTDGHDLQRVVEQITYIPVQHPTPQPQQEGAKLKAEEDSAKVKAPEVTPAETEEATHEKLLPSEILAGDMQSCLSPGSNAINFLKDLLEENTHLTRKDRARVEFAINIFQASSWQGVTVPTVLASEVDTGEDETLDEDTREWLRANFTQLGGGGTQKVKSLKALGNATLFAMRLKRNVTHMVESLPYETDIKTRKVIEQHLMGASKWDFDIWKLRELTHKRELQTLGWHVLEQHGLIQHFGLERPQLRKWLAHIEQLYTDTAYHSATHAADVLQGVHFFLVTAGATRLVSKIEALALLLAAIIHDTGHDGRNNLYHKNAMTDRALKYNDQSIQENFHVALVFEHTVNDPTMNIFGNFNQEQKTELRQLLIKLVLDTDMSRHFSNMQAFQSAIAERRTDPEKWATATETVLCILLHLSDISNPARPKVYARKWAELVLEEFYAQGDLETEKGLPVSPNCGRGTELPSSQIGFISYIVMPFFKLASDMLPELNTLVMPHLTSNLEYWKKLQDPVKVTARRKSLVMMQSAAPAAQGGGGSPLQVTAAKE